MNVWTRARNFSAPEPQCWTGGEPARQSCSAATNLYAPRKPSLAGTAAGTRDHRIISTAPRAAAHRMFMGRAECTAQSAGRLGTVRRGG